MIIPANLNNRVILNDQVQGQKIVIFASPWAINFLRNHNTQLAIDGTFDVEPNFLRFV